MDGPARRPSASRIPRLHLKAPHSAVTGSQSAKKRHAKNFAAHTRPASCGKTTQVSQFILFDEWESGLLVACTQTRVIAATSAARRVAQELDVDLGDEVRYAVRFDNTSNDRTRLKFLTTASCCKSFVLTESLADVLA